MPRGFCPWEKVEDCIRTKSSEQGEFLGVSGGELSVGESWMLFTDKNERAEKIFKNFQWRIVRGRKLDASLGQKRRQDIAPIVETHNLGGNDVNKAKRIIENMDKENADAICSQIGTISENATPLKQARYINDILNVTEKMNICMTDTMRKCGGCCLSANAVKIAKRLYAKSNNIAEFLNLLNEADIGGKNLHISGDKIIAVYKKCYCNIPKKVENLNKNYCECSAGWYMRLFSEVFEKKVNVEIVDTIVNGAFECTFEISRF